MYRILYRFLASLARLTVRSERSRDLEIIVLRHQLAVLRRQIDRPELTDADRSLLGAIAAALARPSRTGWLVTPDTLLRQHRLISHDTISGTHRVVVGRFEDETTKRAGGGWSARRSRGLGPGSGGSPPVPAQQGLRRDEPAGSPPSGQGRSDSTKQGPVLVGQLRSVVAAVQHAELVP